MVQQTGSFDTLRARRIILEGNPEDSAFVDSAGNSLKGTDVTVSAPPLPPGLWVMPDGAPQAKTSVQLSVATDRLYYLRPWVPTTDLTITDVRVRNANTGGTVARIGLAELNPDGTPAALAADFGTVDTSAVAGIKEINGLSVVVSPTKTYSYLFISSAALVFDANSIAIGGWGWGASNMTSMIAHKRTSTTVAAQRTGGFSDPPPAGDQDTIGAEALELVQCKVTAA